MKPEFMTIKFLKISIKNILFVLLSLGLFSCGGGGGGGSSNTLPVQKTGVFLDSAVSGAGFETTSGLNGTTTPAGEFQYLPGDTVIFSIGNIELPPVPGDDFVTPLQMGTTGEIDDPRVIKILQLLQSIDSDGIPDNEITIPPEADFPVSGNAIDFGANEAEFQAALAALLATLPGNPTLVSPGDAQAHFEGSLLYQMAGNYNGTFSGGNNGTWSITIDESGNVTGSSSVNRIGQQNSVSEPLSGRVQSDGALLMSVVDGTRSFTGVVTLSGDISGTWENTSPAESGTFTGEKDVLEFTFNAATVPGVYDFVANEGGLTRVYTFNQNGAGFIPFVGGGNSGAFNWSVDPQGRLIVAFSGQNATIPDQITLVSGTAASGEVTLNIDLNGDFVHATVTGSFIRQQQGG